MRTITIGVLLAVAVALGAAGAAGPSAAAPPGAEMTVKPGKVSFGRVVVGTQSKIKSVTFTNRTLMDLSMDGPATNAGTPAGFGFSYHGCGTYHVGESCTSNIVFNPTAVGKVTGEWTVYFKDVAGQSYSVTFSVSGTGIAA